MFENLTERLTTTLRAVSGGGRLNEDNIKDTLREVRKALLEADVALPVVRDFVDAVRSAALGQEIFKNLQPGPTFVKIVRDKLVQLMGDDQVALQLQTTPPAVILMAGLQGAGKTTTVAKLARYLGQQKKKVLVVSVDVYRPAAILQLQTLAEQVGAQFYPSSQGQVPLEIARAAIAEGRIIAADVVIIDTAGRLHVDEAMMQEIKQLHAEVHPAETLFVVDAMTGQDAAKTAKAFNDALELTGVILTKMDGDARGGAALSVRSLTGKPIKFLGSGEKVEALDLFHPDRMASRILGMGDVLSLLEQAERVSDKAKAEKFAKKLQKGKGLNLQDMLDQLAQVGAMGGLNNILEKLPGMSPKVINQLDNGRGPQKVMSKMCVVIQSMTLKERKDPELINSSRKKRIAAGSGTSIQEVNWVLKQHVQLDQMLKKIASPAGAINLMRAMQSGGSMQDMQRVMADFMPAGRGFGPQGKGK